MARATASNTSPSKDALAGLAIDESDLTWRVIGTLNVFRALLALVLMALFFASDESRFFGDRYPALFADIEPIMVAREAPIYRLGIEGLQSVQHTAASPS